MSFMFFMNVYVVLCLFVFDVPIDCLLYTSGECNEKENDEITDDQGVNSKITNNYEGIINEVGVSCKNKLTSSGKIMENEIYKSNTMKMNSDHDNIETGRESERVEISIYKLKREYEGNYFVLSLIHI